MHKSPVVPCQHGTLVCAQACDQIAAPFCKGRRALAAALTLPRNRAQYKRLPTHNAELAKNGCKQLVLTDHAHTENKKASISLVERAAFTSNITRVIKGTTLEEQESPADFLAHHEKKSSKIILLSRAC